MYFPKTPFTFSNFCRHCGRRVDRRESKVVGKDTHGLPTVYHTSCKRLEERLKRVPDDFYDESYPVRAISAGKVINITKGFYGDDFTIVIETHQITREPITLLYNYIKTPIVKIGDNVKPGQNLGES